MKQVTNGADIQHSCGDVGVTLMFDIVSAPSKGGNFDLASRSRMSGGESSYPVFATIPTHPAPIV